MFEVIYKPPSKTAAPKRRSRRRDSKSGLEKQLLEYKLHENCRNYLILESTEQKGNNKTIHILNFEEQVLFGVGRAHTCEVRIQDISVSRYHADIYLCRDGTLTIIDVASKFGTLKQI